MFWHSMFSPTHLLNSCLTWNRTRLVCEILCALSHQIGHAVLPHKFILSSEGLGCGPCGGRPISQNDTQQWRGARKNPENCVCVCSCVCVSPNRATAEGKGLFSSLMYLWPCTHGEPSGRVCGAEIKGRCQHYPRELSYETEQFSVSAPGWTVGAMGLTVVQTDVSRPLK